jgi:hypothetical protein
MISLPFRVACILIAGFFIVLVVTYTYKLNNRKVFWGVGLTTIISILILLGLGILRPSWGTETGMAVIVGISTAIGCAITLIYAAEDLHQKKRAKGKNIAAVGTEPAQGVPDSEHNKVTLPSRLDTELARKIFAKAIEEGYMEEAGSHYSWKGTKALLAYMCGRIYCGDYPEYSKYEQKTFWEFSNGLFPDVELNALFEQTGIGQSSASRLSIRSTRDNRSWLRRLYSLP